MDARIRTGGPWRPLALKSCTQLKCVTCILFSDARASSRSLTGFHHSPNRSSCWNHPTTALHPLEACHLLPPLPPSILRGAHLPGPLPPYSYLRNRGEAAPRRDHPQSPRWRLRRRGIHTTGRSNSLALLGLSRDRQNHLPKEQGRRRNSTSQGRRSG